MRNCKKPRTRNQMKEFYQTPTNPSEEEIRQSNEFVKKLQDADDKRIFYQFRSAMKPYLSGHVTYVDVKHKLVSILRNNEGLLEEFHQLLSCSREVTEDAQNNKLEDALQKRSKPCRDVRMNNLEDKCMEDDMLLHDLASVIKFGKDALDETKPYQGQPPVGFNRVLEWFYRDENVPQGFKTDPARAVLHMLPRMQLAFERRSKAREIKMKRLYNRVRKDNV